MIPKSVLYLIGLPKPMLVDSKSVACVEFQNSLRGFLSTILKKWKRNM